MSGIVSAIQAVASIFISLIDLGSTYTIKSTATIINLDELQMDGDLNLDGTLTLE